MSSQELKVEI